MPSTIIYPDKSTVSASATQSIAMVRVTVQALAATVLLSAAHARTCPTDLLSCANGKAPKQVDPCCVPTPGGLFLFRQRFEPDVGAEGGRWGIDGVDVLK